MPGFCRRGACGNHFGWVFQGPVQLQVDRGAMGMPLSSTGPIPSYFTQRLSCRLLSLVHVADQFWACWEAGGFGLIEGRLPGPGQV